MRSSYNEKYLIIMTHHYPLPAQTLLSFPGNSSHRASIAAVSSSQIALHYWHHQPHASIISGPSSVAITNSMSTVPYHVHWQRKPSSANSPIIMLLQIRANSNSRFSEHTVATFLDDLRPVIVRDCARRYRFLSFSCVCLRETRHRVYFLLNMRFRPIPQEHTLVTDWRFCLQDGGDDSDSSSVYDPLPTDPTNLAAAA